MQGIVSVPLVPRVAVVACAVLLAVGVCALAACASPSSGVRRSGHVDVLFIGAHPDDELRDLPTFGQWHENLGLSVGVVTITRGEGGGNAVGPEEGPALGLLREGEERKAVALAGIQDVYYLDKVDFFYTVSAPLTRSVWGEQDTLSRVVRLIRETTPKIIVTMNPAPVPGQHGNHQEAGRLAIEAYFDAGDPLKFGTQISDEHLSPWQASRLFAQGASGTGPAGATCSSAFTPTDPTQDVYGVWAGAPSRTGNGNWAQIAVQAAHFYVTQGLGATPPPPTDPQRIPCIYYTQIDSRVPFTIGNRAPDAMLEGATAPTRGGLPAGTELFLTTSRSTLTPEQSFEVTVHSQAPAGRSLADAQVALQLPTGWTAAAYGKPDRLGSTQFQVTIPADTTNGRYRVSATLHTSAGTGTNSTEVLVQPPVVAQAQQLPQLTDFDQWAASAAVPQLAGRVKNVQTLGVGTSRPLPVEIKNDGLTEEHGIVTPQLPSGFAVNPSSLSYSLKPGTGISLPFTVRNTDPTLATSNQGPDDGDYNYSIVTTNSAGAAEISNAALELVPSTIIPHVDAPPAVDGAAEPGEYPGLSLPISRRWRGVPCSSEADCGGYAKVQCHLA